MNFVNILNHKYGKLIVVERDGHRNTRVAWRCQCECGKIKQVTSNDLRTGKVISCGKPGCRVINYQAAHEAVITHGMSNTRLYRIWTGMKRRCNNLHEHYSLKGITYCKEWEDFEPFKNWAIKAGYKDVLTIDRIDYNGNYKPENCRWATRKQQARNTSSNKLITFEGITRCMSEWAEIKNINYRTLTDRLRRGWPLERALTK